MLKTLFKMYLFLYGAGAPYPDMSDYSLEDEVQKLIIQKQKGQKLSDDIIDDYVRKIELK